jgi:putative membrane protein
MHPLTPAPHRHPVPRGARRVAAGLALPLVVLVLTAPGAAGAAGARPAAADGDVVVTNTETVQARLDPSGLLREARVYEQLTFTGTGSASVTNPVAGTGVRNLDGFARLDASDGTLRTTVDVDGARRLRTVSDFDGDLPLGVEVSYSLDGEPVEPGGVLGRSGALEVRYTVTNLTARDDEVAYDGGTGAQATATAETVVPMVGQLVTTLPPTFTAVTSDQANISGDGRGGTRLTFQMTLFPPIGASSVELAYRAQVTRAVVPPATITALPVSPLTNASFKGGSASYASGAQSGVALSAGATEIDANLLRLRDGASELLSGLVQLRDGAERLAEGLTLDAAPGSVLLADGLDTADAGARELTAGARQLDAGARQLADGSARLDAGLTRAGTAVPQLLGGLTQVDAGLARVDAGLAALSGSVGMLPGKAQALHDGITRVRAGIGDVTNPQTLLGGAEGLRVGLTAAATSIGQLEAASGVVAANLGSPQDLAADAAELGAAATTVEDTDPAVADALRATATDLAAHAQAIGTAAAYSQGVASGLADLRGTVTGTVIPGITRLECGLSAASVPGACDPARPGVLEGLGAVDAGVTQLTTDVVAGVQGAVGVGSDTQANGTLRGGVRSVRDGVEQITSGGTTLAAGLGELATGASALSGGASTLADGTGRLSTGTVELAGGTTRLATGADRLAAGLATAADGSTQLADGLTTAADGAPGLVDGAQRLSTEGTSQLVVRGEQTASDYGVRYAVIEAGAQRAADEGMAYGAPVGAAGATAYSIEIAGVDGVGARSLGRGVAAVALFGLGAVVAGLLGRRIA